MSKNDGSGTKRHFAAGPLPERKEKEMENTPLTSRELLLLKQKRRRRKRLLILLAVLLLCLAAGGGGFFLWMRSRRAVQETVQITAGEQEEITYARIDTIVGNEMETTLLDASVAEQMEAGAAEMAAGGEAEGMAAGGGMPEGMEMPEGGMPEGMEMPGGGMPEGMEMPGGGMPEGMEMPGGGMPEGMEMPDAAEEPGDGRTAEAGGETKTWQIPVGTDVITTLGVSTTFSRLSAGDVIAVLTEAGTDNILKIWIVQ